ncbi:Kelch repeat-containing protein [Geothrix terrae]|uniref:Kelch repeat-containing protein n=1 Tax=Geothrix terrae TaxID=2922720 RepID=UPI001FAE016D|nr:hypothetical protein [Geothrix terrae]
MLIVGGETLGHTLLSGTVALAELYDPAAKTFSPAGNLNIPRFLHDAVLLPSGHVLVVGGAGLSSGNGFPVSEIEEWNPDTKTFSVVGSTVVPRPGCKLFLRQDGKVQIVGGYDDNVGITASDFSTEVFDPATHLAQFDFALMDVEQNATLVALDPSHFMLMGGENGEGGWHQLNSAYEYVTDGSPPNPSRGGTMPYSFTHGAGVNLPTGKVFVAGGYSYSLPIGIHSAGGVLAEGVIIDYTNVPSTMVLIPLMEARMGHQAILFPDGTVGLVAGETFTGYVNTQFLSDIEVVDVAKMQSHLLQATLKYPRSNHTVTPLKDGSFLIAGGYNYISASYTSMRECEVLIYQ